MTYFLVRRLPDSIRDALESEAAERGVPLAEIGREIMCAYYGKECGRLEVNSYPRRELWRGSKSIQLHLDDEVWRALKEDAAETGESMQSIVHGAFAAHYERTPV